MDVWTISLIGAALALGAVIVGICLILRIRNFERRLGAHIDGSSALLSDAMDDARRMLVDETRKSGERYIAMTGDVLRAQQTQLDDFAGRIAEFGKGDRELWDATRDELEGKMTARLDSMTLEMRRVYEGLADIRAMSGDKYDPEQSAEIWRLIDQTRGEFEVFADALSRTQKRIRQANESIEDAARKSQLFNKKLKHVKGRSGSEDESDI